MEKTRAGANNDLWGQLETALIDCFWKIELFWVNSHPEEVMDIRPEVPEIAYVGNKIADEKARAAADEVEIPAGDAAQHKEAMERSKEILMRLTTLALDMVIELAGKKVDRQKTPRNTLKKRRDKAWSETEHHIVVMTSGSLHCTKCRSRSAPNLPQQVRWLEDGCGTLLNKPHKSHMLQDKKNIVWCGRCGAWSSSRYRALGMPCEGKPKTGLQTMNLRRAEKGQLPPGTSEITLMTSTSKTNHQEGYGKQKG